MKRIISLFLAVIVMFSSTVTISAADEDEEYYTVPVEYSDHIGGKENLDIMVQNDHVFVDAKMIAERLGYTFEDNGEGAVIYNRDRTKGLPFCITQFKYNSTQVSHMLFSNMIDTYETPFASVKNSKGVWIPFEYSLLLINSGMMIADKAILIDIPEKTILDYFYDVAANSAKYNFDWADDFGYTETDVGVFGLGGYSHLLNVFNGLLDFDGASWVMLFQQFTGSMASYDEKYGEKLAMLMCTESDKELQAVIDEVDRMVDLLDEDGKLGRMLSSTSFMLDAEVGTLYEQCGTLLEKVDSGNSPLVTYNRSYQALEHALDKEMWFSDTGGYILEIQKGVSDYAGNAFTALDIGMRVLEIVGYAKEFRNQDDFSLAALQDYLNNSSSGPDFPKAMKKSMIEYSDSLSGDISGYMCKRFFDNIDSWIIWMDDLDGGLHKVLGTQAAQVLFAWNIASDTIPFIADGLSSADNFELAMYSMVFQGDSFSNYLDKRNSVFKDSGNITPDNLYEVSQYCYIYLKSCYITREAAIASLENRTNATKEKIQPLIDEQNNINCEIAKILGKLKAANKRNEGCVFGFLLADNEEYLRKYSDSQLISWIEGICSIEGTIEGQRDLYTEFLLNGGYNMILSYAAEYEYDDGDGYEYEFSTERPENWENLEISACFANFDSDPDYELLISLTDTMSGGIKGPACSRALLDIQNGTVQIVAVSDFCGGSMGGAYLEIKYDEEMDRYVVIHRGIVYDGYRADIVYTDIYSTDGLYSIEKGCEQYCYNLDVPADRDIYRDEIEQIKNETTFYKERDGKFYCWHINGDYVDEEEYNSVVDRYSSPINENYSLRLGTYENPIAFY